MYEKEITDDVVRYLSQIEGATCIPYDDFTEPRDNAMIIVGIDDTEQVNFGLDDFRYSMTVLIDVMIDSDKDGALMDSIKDAVLDVLHPIFDDPERFSDIFADLDRIVFFHFGGMSASVVDRQSLTEIKIEIIGSFN